MSGKFFSFIKGGRLHIAPGKKIVPKDDFSKMLESKEVLENVQKDAAIYRQSVAEECEKLKEIAQKEGYEMGFEKWAEHLVAFQKNIESLRDEYTKVLAPIALKAAQKIVGRAFDLSHDAVYDIVANALKPVLQHKRITIWVNKNDREILEKNRNRLKDLFENVELLSIREREDISQGGCIIETEGGIINAELENQWAILEKALSSLFKNDKALVKENLEAKQTESKKEG
ncbi:HrpE/YscL family type III secretion apparatus protein [Criblamydia sequanensis]|uniref:Flagellar assembly protein FliH n=1 Tax=Candidatus Criblamydia sequanensis CRIB-18 TaxID=1437425 RepID=A0A090CZW9_9BACT|nr:HrpE/YscL family type III secretion apparatus protein [Criblamydia sequanensis]CDR34566.1 Type III secretion protein SctL [Criblamydia sequanensis CRIB-18]